MHTCHVANTPSCHLLLYGPVDFEPQYPFSCLILQIAAYLGNAAIYIDDCSPDKDTDGIQVDSSTPPKPLRALALRQRLFLIDRNQGKNFVGIGNVPQGRRATLFSSGRRYTSLDL